MQRSYLDYPIALTEQQSDAKRLIILLHGFGASLFSWRTVTKPLSELGQVIAYDRPGFGNTPTVARTESNDPYSLAGQVKLLDAIIDKEANGRDVILIGHSSGSLVAAEYTLRNPDKVKKLILESPAIWRKAPIPNFVGKLLRNKVFEKPMAKRLLNFDKTGMQILYKSWFAEGGPSQEIIDGYRQPLENPEWTLRFWRFLSASQKNQVRENLWRFDLPVLVITGQHDEIIKVEYSFKVAERIPGHKIYLVPEAGHLAHEEQAADFLRVVTNFIKK